VVRIRFCHRISVRGLDLFLYLPDHLKKFVYLIDL
jgi:hypothetical protein